MKEEKVIYAPEIRLFTYHLKLLKTTAINGQPDREIDLKSMIAYYVQLLADYGLLNNLLIQKFSKDIFSPLLIIDTWLEDIDKSYFLVWWSKFRIFLWQFILDTDIVDLLYYYVFRSDFEKLSTENNIPFFQLIYNPGKIGIQRVDLPPKYRGFFYPQYINDSYSFLLHLLHPEKLGEGWVKFSDIAELSPPESFFTGTSSTLDEPRQTHLKQASWGTTILFSGLIKSPPPVTLEDGKQLADELLQNLLKPDPEKPAPPFWGSREFLGGFLYEYQDVYNRHPYGQILILLLFSEESKEKLNAVQWSLPELFCYERKICQNYLDSREEYKRANQDIETIEETIRTFPPNIATNVPPDLSEEELRSLKREIKNLLDLSLRYSQRMRSLVTFQNTIAINRENYLNTLTRMEVKSHSDLTGWRDKANHIFGTFQRQIEVDLVYLQQGERLLDTAINTIRGLVEIDQAERDRHRENTEKDNREKQEKDNQKLQNQIQAVGVGIAAGAIVASSSGLITHPWGFPSRDRLLLPPHPFIIALAISSLCSIFAWKITQAVINKNQRKSHN